MSKLCATVTPFNWEAVQDKHLHLMNLDIKVPPGPIYILIGMDHAELLITSVIRRGKEDEPYGVLTQLRWVVRGKTSETKKNTDSLSPLLSSGGNTFTSAV